MTFSFPFEPWVIESWKKHSEKCGGPEIAEAFRYNYLNHREIMAGTKPAMKYDKKIKKNVFKNVR